MNPRIQKSLKIKDGIQRLMGSFDLQHWAHIGAMNLRGKTLLHMQQSFAQA